MKMLAIVWHNTFLVGLVALVGILANGIEALPMTIGLSPSVVALDHWLHTSAVPILRADGNSKAEESGHVLRKRSEFAPALDIGTRATVQPRDTKPPPSGVKKSGILNRPWKRILGGGGRDGVMDEI